jgi:hypothetical protein
MNPAQVLITVNSLARIFHEDFDWTADTPKRRVRLSGHLGTASRLVVLANLRTNIYGQECIRCRRYDEAAEELGERGHCF